MDSNYIYKGWGDQSYTHATIQEIHLLEPDSKVFMIIVTHGAEL